MVSKALEYKLNQYTPEDIFLRSNSDSQRGLQQWHVNRFYSSPSFVFRPNVCHNSASVHTVQSPANFLVLLMMVLVLATFTSTAKQKRVKILD